MRLLTDANGTRHTYEYDKLGRPIHGRVTTLASGTDGSVRRLSTTEGLQVEGVREDLIVPLASIDTGAMLKFWRWLLPESHQPLFATALGDLFLTDPEGRVLWLDIGDGQLQQVAADAAEFGRAAADPDNNSLWFGTVLVDELRAAGWLCFGTKHGCIKVGHSNFNTRTMALRSSPRA